MHVYPSLLATLLLAITACDRKQQPTTVAPAIQRREMTLEYIKPAETVATLQSAFKSETGVIHFESTPAGQGIIMESTEPGLLEKATGILQEIDKPISCAATRFIKLKNVAAVDTVEYLTTRMPIVCKTLQAIPDIRTNRVLIMGHPQDMLRAEEMIHDFDESQATLQPSVPSSD